MSKKEKIEINESQNKLDTTWYKDALLVVFDWYGTCFYIKKWIRGRFSKELNHILQTNDIWFDQIVKGKLEYNWKVFKISRGDIKRMKKNLASVSAYEDFEDNIQYLHDTWHKTAICSNLAQPYIEPIENEEIVKKWCFDHKFYSCKIWCRKPNPLIFQKIIEESGVSADKIVFVWDSFKSDIEWASGAWMKVVLIDRQHEGDAKNIEKEWINLIIIHTLDQLKEIF